MTTPRASRPRAARSAAVASPQPDAAGGLAPREQALWNAQLRAEALFATVVGQRLLRPGVLESELSEEIHALARARFGVRRHWHRRVVRSGPNSALTYYDSPPDRRLEADDVVYLDFGPVFGRWEADLGRTYVLGDDPRKQQLVRDIGDAFRQGQALYAAEPTLTAGQLYDYVAARATAAGWTFGAKTAGHIIDEFPHGRTPDPGKRYSIRSGNPTELHEPCDDGRARHWILEIHFVDHARRYGGFLEELLTIRGPR
jgi:Xaa-Pro aminopeptidase